MTEIGTFAGLHRGRLCGFRPCVTGFGKGTFEYLENLLDHCRGKEVDTEMVRKCRDACQEVTGSIIYLHNAM